MKEKHITKFFLTCATLVTCITLGVNLCFQHSTKAVVAESSETSDTVTADFIASIGETAQQIGQKRNLCASVMVTQTVLESSSGQSTLSQSPYHNFFGIKGSYNDDSVAMLAWEDDGDGNTYKVSQVFRSCDSLNGSLNGYASLLSWDLYSGMWRSNTTSYRNAITALTGLYTIGTSYADKLNALIEQYDLTVCDEPVSTEERTSSGDNPSHVWDEYRGSYTTTAILTEGEAWLRFISQ